MAVTLVQQKVGTTNATTFDSNVTAGNTIVVLIQYISGTARSISSVTDNQGNVYTVLSGATHQDIASPNYAQISTDIAYATNVAAGATTVTVTLSGGTIITVASILELTASVFDQATGNTGTGTSPSAGSLTTPVNGCFGVAVAITDDSFGAGGGWTAGSGWTVRQNTGGGNAEWGTEDIAQATAGVLAGNFTQSHTGTWVVSFATFKPTGAIAFDATSSSSYQPTVSSYSWSHTCTGTNRGLIVGISIFAAGTVTAVTYAGTNLTFLGAIPNGLYRQEFWGMAAPASGTNTIAVTLSTSLTSIGNAISYTGVNQTTPFVDLKPAIGTGNPASVVVTPATDNDWIVDSIATSDSSVTVGAGQTSRANNSGALGSGAMSDKGPVTPASAQTMQWTGIGALDTWAYLGVAVDPFVDLPVYTPALGIVEIRGEVIPYWVETPAGDLMLMGVGS